MVAAEFDRERLWVQDRPMPYLTVVEAAKLTGRSRQSIYALAKRGKVKTTTTEDGTLLIQEESLLDYCSQDHPGGRPRKSGRPNKRRGK